MTKEPKYHNKQVLIYCLNKKTHPLLFNKQFINYNKKTVIELCEDLEVNFDYLISLIENEKDQLKFSKTASTAHSLVWTSLFYHHNDVIPEKYKQDYD